MQRSTSGELVPTEPVSLAALGLAATFALILLHVPVGVAMGLAGIAGFGLLVGWEPAFAMIASETSNAFCRSEQSC